MIGKGAKVGARPEDMEDLNTWGVAVVGAQCIVPEGAVIEPKEMIDAEIYNKEAGK